MCGDEAPRMIRYGSPTPAITALTSECTGLIVATAWPGDSALAGTFKAQLSSTATAAAPSRRRGRCAARAHHKGKWILTAACLIVVTMFYLDRRETLPTDTLLGLLAHGGLYASARLDTPSGPSIVVAALALFILTRIRLPKSGGGKR